MSQGADAKAMADAVFAAVKVLVEHRTASLAVRIAELERRIAEVESTQVKAEVVEIRRVAG